jgi:thiol-disulfide isomerase/thioredoxin
MRRLWGVFLVLLAVAQAPAAELKDLPVPRPAMPLVLPALAGGEADLKQWRGQVVLVNFWASWCPPCRKEMPSMNRLADKLAGRPFAILGVNAGEDAATIRAFMKQTPVDFPILLDEEGGTVKPWQAFVFPTSYVVDKQGRLRLGLVGSIEWDAPEVVARLEALLRE